MAPGCEVFELQNCKEVTDAALVSIGECCEVLNVIDITGCTGVSYAGVAQLVEVAEELVQVIGCGVVLSDDMLEELAELDSAELLQSRPAFAKHLDHAGDEEAFAVHLDLNPDSAETVVILSPNAIRRCTYLTGMVVGYLDLRNNPFVSDEVLEVRCLRVRVRALFDRALHSRMPLSLTPLLRLKRPSV
jgi:hypothetical protein